MKFLANVKELFTEYEYVWIKGAHYEIPETNCVELLMEIRQKVYEKVNRKFDETFELIGAGKPGEVYEWLKSEGYMAVIGSPGVWSRVKP